MKLCDGRKEDHATIAHNKQSCPLCKALAEIAKLRRELADLQDNSKVTEEDG